MAGTRPDPSDGSRGRRRPCPAGRGPRVLPRCSTTRSGRRAATRPATLGATTIGARVGWADLERQTRVGADRRVGHGSSVSSPDHAKTRRSTLPRGGRRLTGRPHRPPPAGPDRRRDGRRPGGRRCGGPRAGDAGHRHRRQRRRRWPRRPVERLGPRLVVAGRTRCSSSRRPKRRRPSCVGRADLVTARFPWGSLLRGMVGLEPAASGRSGLAGRAGGELEALVSVHPRDGLAEIGARLADLVGARPGLGGPRADARRVADRPTASRWPRPGPAGPGGSARRRPTGRVVTRVRLVRLP